MEDRAALLRAWLEGEGERQRRPVVPPPAANDADARGWVQVGVCALGGVLAAVLLVSWLIRAWDLSVRENVREQLRLEGFRMAVGDPNKSAWWKEEGKTAGRNGGAQALVLCDRELGIAFGTVVGAWFLRVACSLYNKLAGGKGTPGSVPEPLFVQALGITFVAALVHTVLGLGLLSALVNLLVMAGMNALVLPTTFARGVLVTLCYVLVSFVVVVVLAFVVGGVFLALP